MIGSAVTTTGSFYLFRGMFSHIQTPDTTNDDDPAFSVEITQLYHANNLGSGVDSGKASIIYRPNSGILDSGEKTDALSTLETYIKWENSPATSDDKIQLRFRMVPILLE